MQEGASFAEPTKPKLGRSLSVVLSLGVETNLFVHTAETLGLMRALMTVSQIRMETQI